MESSLWLQILMVLCRCCQLIVNKLEIYIHVKCHWLGYWHLLNNIVLMAWCYLTLVIQTLFFFICCQRWTRFTTELRWSLVGCLKLSFGVLRILRVLRILSFVVRICYIKLIILVFVTRWSWRVTSWIN